MAGVIVHEWVQKNCDVKRCMKVGKISDTMFASLLPHLVTKVDRVTGDGGVGTLKHLHLNPDITGGQQIIMKEKVTVFNEETGDFHSEVVDDPKFKTLKNIMKMTPTAEDPEATRLVWTMEYDPVDPAEPAPTDIDTMHCEVMRVLMNYVDTHPDWP